VTAPRAVRQGLRYALLPNTLPEIAADNPCRGLPLTEPAALVWHPQHPHEVQLRFQQAKTWVFALELLEDGLDGPAGLGDVFVAPAPGYRVVVVLDSYDGHAALHFSTVAIRTFLEAVAAVWEDVELDDERLAAWIARAEQ
jgi:hypothetical protein